MKSTESFINETPDLQEGFCNCHQVLVHFTQRAPNETTLKLDFSEDVFLEDIC